MRSASGRSPMRPHGSMYTIFVSPFHLNADWRYQVNPSSMRQHLPYECGESVMREECPRVANERDHPADPCGPGRRIRAHVSRGGASDLGRLAKLGGLLAAALTRAR